MLPVEVLNEVLPQIIDKGIECAPAEACGLICPDGTVYFLTNESEEEGHFLISGEQLSTAFYDEDGVCSLGFGVEDVVLWHTHPSGYPGPSRDDIKSRQQLPELKHMVIALPGGEAAYY